MGSAGFCPCLCCLDYITTKIDFGCGTQAIGGILMCHWRVRNSQDQHGAQGGTSEPLGLSRSRERPSSSSSSFSSSPYLSVCSVYLESRNLEVRVGVAFKLTVFHLIVVKTRYKTRLLLLRECLPIQAWYVMVCAWKRCNNINTGGRCTILAARLIEWNWNQTMWVRWCNVQLLLSVDQLGSRFGSQTQSRGRSSDFMTSVGVSDDLLSRHIKEYTTFCKVKQRLTSENCITATYSFYSSSSSIYIFFYGDHIDKNMPVDTDAGNKIKKSSILFSVCQSIWPEWIRILIRSIGNNSVNRTFSCQIDEKKKVCSKITRWSSWNLSRGEPVVSTFVIRDTHSAGESRADGSHL